MLLSIKLAHCIVLSKCFSVSRMNLLHKQRDENEMGITVAAAFKK